MTAEQLYLMRCNTPHNIDKHLPVIRRFASECAHVTELGVERGWSTSALLASGAKYVRSIDVSRWQDVSLLETLAIEEGIDFKFIQGDSRTIDIEETDLLFVDTEHTYEQVDAELERHLSKVRRYVIFHDIVAFPCIIPAIRKHCTSDRWACILWSETQSGLAVFQRVQ